MKAFWLANWEWLLPTVLVPLVAALVPVIVAIIGKQRKQEDKRVQIEIKQPEPVRESVAAVATYEYHRGEVDEEMADYRGALEHYSKAEQEYLQATGPSTPERAAALASAGIKCCELAQYNEAIAKYKQALAICKEKDNQEGIAAIYNNIANVYSEQGKYEEALRWYFKAFAIREKVLGREHPDTAMTYNNIALVFSGQGKYDTALEWYFKALAIREKVLGKEYPDTATTCNNIGAVYGKQGKYDTALEWYFKALAIREKVLGNEYPDTARTYESVAIVYSEQEKFNEAFPLYITAYRIYLDKFDESHPDATRCRNNMSIDYTAAHAASPAAYPLPFSQWLAAQLAQP